MLTETALSVNSTDPEAVGVEDTMSAVGYRCRSAVASADQKAALPVLLMIFSLPQGGLCVLAMQSVFEESLPRPSVDAVRGEMMPSCWVLQPIRRNGQEVTRVFYLLQVRYGCYKRICQLIYVLCSRATPPHFNCQ